MKWTRLRLFDLFREAPIAVWLVAFIIVPLSLVVSFVVSRYSDLAREANRQVFQFTLVGILIGCSLFLAIMYLMGRGGVSPLLTPLPKVKALLIAFGCAITAWGVSIVITGHFSQMMREPGALFVMLFSVLSLVGFWASFSSILEFRRVITSFHQLHVQLLDLIRDTRTRPEQDLRILAYTPAIGFLALPQRKWDELEAALHGIKRRLQIVCLDPEDLRYWHGLYKGRRTLREPISHTVKGPAGTPRRRDLDDDDIEAANNAAESILGFSGVKEKCERKKLEMLPGFYLIFNDDKAIIVTPFFIPFPPGTPPEVQKDSSDVQMFGVETSDRGVIKDVDKIFRAYKEDVPSRPRPLFATDTADTAEAIERIKSCLQLEACSAARVRFRLSVFEDA